jgi:hypothetical protein
MATNLPLDAVIQRVDRALESLPVRSGAPDLRSFLIDELYLEAFRPEESRTPWREALRHRAVDLASRLARGPLRQTVRVDRSFTGPLLGPRHLFVLSFPWEDTRTTGVLRRILEELSDAAIGVTDREDVFLALRGAGIPCLRIRTPRALHRREVPLVGGRPRDRRVMARGAALLETADRLLAELRPTLVLSCQDFFSFDQAFTRAARLRGIPTITHQHGQIPAGPTSVYKYLFSDRMAVWGQRSAALMEQHVDPSRLWIVGTDRFDGLDNRRAPRARDRLVLGLNPISDAGNRALLREVTAALLREAGGPISTLTPVIKLHPSLDPAQWRHDAAAAGGIPWQVWTGSNEELLSRTRFLLARRSTLTLDAAVAGASVIELGAAGGFGAVPGLFDDLPESLVETCEVGVVLSRRMSDPALEAALLTRQGVSLDLEIEPGSSTAREVAVLRAMLGGTP